MNQPPYNAEIWRIDGFGRVEYLRAGSTYSEALESLRTLAKALNWKSYGAGVYLLVNGIPKWECKFVIQNGKRRDLI